MSTAAVRERARYAERRERGSKYRLEQARNRRPFIDKLFAHRGAMQLGDSDGPEATAQRMTMMIPEHFLFWEQLRHLAIAAVPARSPPPAGTPRSVMDGR